MYTQRIEPLQSRILIALLLFAVFPICGFSKKKNVQPPVMDSIQAARFMDSIHRLYLNEVDFIIDRIENTYISGRRGMSDEEWKTKEKLEVAIIEQLKKAMLTGDASSPDAAKLARMHVDWIRMQWAQGAYSAQAHVCLARGYLADDRFVEYYDSRAGKGATEFLVEAIEAALG